MLAERIANLILARLGGILDPSVLGRMLQLFPQIQTGIKEKLQTSTQPAYTESVRTRTEKVVLKPTSVESDDDLDLDMMKAVAKQLKIPLED